MRKIKLSGKFLVNLISGKYPCFILEKIPPLEGEISHQIDIQKDIEFIIKEYGDWQTKGEGSYYFNQDLHNFITNYLSSLISKVKEPKTRQEIKETIFSSPFTNHESLIIATEVLVTAAIKYPQNYPYILHLLQSQRTRYRLHNQNAPYILLSSLYGNEKLSQTVTENIADSSLHIYYFSKPPAYERNLNELIHFTNSESSLPKIQAEVAKLTLKPNKE